MADNLTSMDFDGDSDSGNVDDSDAQSVCSEATLIGSPTPSVQGDEANPGLSLSIGGTTHQSSEVGSTSSGYHSDAVGSTTSDLNTRKCCMCDQFQESEVNITNSDRVTHISERNNNFSPITCCHRVVIMADNVTSMDFDGDSDSGVVTGSDTQSISSEATLIGSPIPSVHGDEAIPDLSLPSGGTTHQSSGVGSTTSGYHSGGVVGSTSSGYHSDGADVTFHQQAPRVIPHHQGSQTGGSGGFSLQNGNGGLGSNSEHLLSQPGQATLPGNQDSTKSTQEWIDKHFDVFVKTLEGKTFTIKTSADESVTSFRAKVDEKTGVPGTEQRLTSQAGRTLENGKSLRDYEIGRHSTIYCQGRLRGGFFINKI